MSPTANHLWIGGWGVAPEAVRERLALALPGASVTVLPPCPASLETALASPDTAVLGGWSLGARLLLDALAVGKIPANRRLTLVCPFLAFPSEGGQGGRASVTQVKFLRRWLAKDAPAALADFYQRAGLHLPDPDALPYPLADLDAGLAILADPTPFDFSACRLPPSALALAGARDPLLDNTRLAELLPGLKILPEAGHDLADFTEEIGRHT